MPCFLWDLLCGLTETDNRIRDLRENLDGNQPIIKKYLRTLSYQYKLMKFRKKIFKSLRLLQFLGGFGITTMTTYNNPYFKDNVDTINIIVWYVSISNNVFNLLIEKLNAYDLTIDKMKVKLLIREGELLESNQMDYRFYELDDTDNKLAYFNRCYSSILSDDPYNYLTNNNVNHNDEIDTSRRRRLNRVWTLAPTPENDDEENNEGEQ